MATCPNGHENPEDQRFCGECGEQLVETVLPDSELARWREAGFTAEMAAAWRQAGFTLEDAGFWASEPFAFDPAEAATWIGMSRDPEEITEWMDLGFGAEDAARWRGIDTTLETHDLVDADTAAEWRDTGFTPDDTALWLGIDGIDEPNYADWWREAGFSPEEAVRWVPAFGVAHMYEAKEWRNSGADPDSAAPSPQGSNPIGHGQASSFLPRLGRIDVEDLDQSLSRGHLVRVARKYPHRWVSVAHFLGRGAAREAIARRTGSTEAWPPGGSRMWSIAAHVSPRSVPREFSLVVVRWNGPYSLCKQCGRPVERAIPSKHDTSLGVVDAAGYVLAWRHVTEPHDYCVGATSVCGECRKPIIFARSNEPAGGWISRFSKDSPVWVHDVAADAQACPSASTARPKNPSAISRRPRPDASTGIGAFL